MSDVFDRAFDAATTARQGITLSAAVPPGDSHPAVVVAVAQRQWEAMQRVVQAAREYRDAGLLEPRSPGSRNAALYDALANLEKEAGSNVPHPGR